MLPRFITSVFAIFTSQNFLGLVKLAFGVLATCVQNNFVRSTSRVYFKFLKWKATTLLCTTNS